MSPPLKRTKLEDAFNKEGSDTGKIENCNGDNGVASENGTASTITAEQKRKINENAVRAF